MDYCEDFRLIQATLNHCNEYVKKFDKISSYGGNEIYVKEVALRLRNVFLLRGYNNLESDELRKINLLLMLNTDASYKYDPKEDFEICHLVNNFAQLTKCLYAHLVWQLKLEKYYFEALRYAPSWFVLQFLEEAIDSLRFSSSFDAIDHVKDFVEGVYANICRMDYRYSKRPEQQIDQKITLAKFIEHITSSLRIYNTPVTDDSVTQSKRKMREYNGRALNNLLQLALACLKMFLAKPTFEVDERLRIYKIHKDREPETDNFSACYSAAIQEALLCINVILLNTLQNSAFNVTMQDFVYWVEVDWDDHDLSTRSLDLRRNNLQRMIGEQAYELIELIGGSPEFKHNVVNQLSTIAIKPKTLVDVAKEATVGTVLERIENSDSRAIWLEELLSRENTLYFNAECLQTVIDNADIVGLAQLLKILNDLQKFPMDDDEDEALMKEIFFKAGWKLSAGDMSVFIEELIRLMGCDYNLQTATDASYECEIRNYMNKITHESIEEATMWRLILAHPRKFYKTLLDLDVNQEETTILNIIEATSSVASNFIKELIIEKEFADIKKSPSYRPFLVGLCRLDILERKEFVKDILMSNFTQATMNGDLELLLVHLQVLKQVSHHLKISDLLPPLMIHLAQILDKFRWDMMTYSDVREDVVDTTIGIIQQLIKTVLINGSQHEKEWIVSKIGNMKALTQFYFQKLSLEKGEAPSALDEFLQPGGFGNVSKAKIVTFLCETLVRCTSKECKKLMNNNILEKFYTESLTLVATIAKKSNQSAPVECIKKCVKDYAKILTEAIIPKSERDESLLKDIINLMKQFPATAYDDLTILLLEALKLFQQCDNFANALCELEECAVKRICLQQH